MLLAPHQVKEVEHPVIPDAALQERLAFRARRGQKTTRGTDVPEQLPHTVEEGPSPGARPPVEGTVLVGDDPGLLCGVAEDHGEGLGEGRPYELADVLETLLGKPMLHEHLPGDGHDGGPRVGEGTVEIEDHEALAAKSLCQG